MQQKKSVGINSHGSAGNSHSHWGGYPFPPIPIHNSVFHSHCHGIPIPIGNPIPTHISITQYSTQYSITVCIVTDRQTTLSTALAGTSQYPAWQTDRQSTLSTALAGTSQYPVWQTDRQSTLSTALAGTSQYPAWQTDRQTEHAIYSTSRYLTVPSMTDRQTDRARYLQH